MGIETFYVMLNKYNNTPCMEVFTPVFSCQRKNFYEMDQGLTKTFSMTPNSRPTTAHEKAAPG